MYYVLVPLSAVVALGVIQVARRGPRPVSLGSEALGHRHHARGLGMSRSELVDVLRGYRLAVVATVAADGQPQAAVVGIAISDGLEIVFDTVVGSRKAQNLQRDPRVGVVSWGGYRLGPGGYRPNRRRGRHALRR